MRQEQAGALSPAAVFIDGYASKASANLNKKIKQEVPAGAKRYRDELLAEINADGKTHGKKPSDDGKRSPRPNEKRTGQHTQRSWRAGRRQASKVHKKAPQTRLRYVCEGKTMSGSLL